MNEEIDSEKVHRIVKRIKGALKIKDILEQSDIHLSVNPFYLIVHEVLVRESNEFMVKDIEFANAVLKTLKQDEEVSLNNYKCISECVHKYL